ESTPGAARRTRGRNASRGCEDGKQGLEIGDHLFVVIQGQVGIVSGIGRWPDGSHARLNVRVNGAIHGRYGKSRRGIAMPLRWWVCLRWIRAARIAMAYPRPIDDVAPRRDHVAEPKSPGAIATRGRNIRKQG